MVNCTSKHTVFRLWLHVVIYIPFSSCKVILYKSYCELYLLAHCTGRWYYCSIENISDYFILSKIYDLSKKFALPDTLLKLKKILYRPRKCQDCYTILLCSPGRKMQNLLFITQLNVIGTVFNLR